MTEKYIPLKEAAERLQVARGTLFYYLKRLEIEPVKFDLDKQKYITVAQFERIHKLREAAIERSMESTGEYPSVKKPEAA